MNWQEREYAGDQHAFGRPGGDWQGLRPTLDNPMTWSLFLFRLSGISVRVHLFFILFIIIMLLRAATGPSHSMNLPDVTIVAIGMGVLFLLVLAHEFGHCLACRRSGGEADEILMWPLGGLAYVRPLNNWKSHFISTAGGPAVNVIVCIVAGCMLGVITGIWWTVALPNPLDPFAGLNEPKVSQSLAHLTLYLIHATSFLLLLFNLLPIFPLDGGRLVQALLWRWFGYTRSMTFAVRTGYIGALGLFVYGAVINNMWLVGIALFGAATCYITHKQMQWTEQTLGFESDEYALSLHASDPDESAAAAPSPTSSRAERQALREQEEAREVDRILQKIADTGIDSLSRSEKALLKRVTERKRMERG